MSCFLFLVKYIENINSLSHLIQNCIQNCMDTAEHPNWSSHGPKANVNLLKLEVNFFDFMIWIARFSFHGVFNHSRFMNCVKVKL